MQEWRRERRERILKLVKEGMTPVEIALRFGVTSSMVRKIIEREEAQNFGLTKNSEEDTQEWSVALTGQSD